MRNGNVGVILLVLVVACQLFGGVAAAVNPGYYALERLADMLKAVTP